MRPSPAVLLLHGVGLDHTMWDSVRHALPPHLGVMAADLLGHGSAAPAPRNCTLADLANHVAQEMDAAVHVVGFSLGAMVGQQLALHHPDRVASLVCVSSVHDRTPQQRQAVAHRLRRAEDDFDASAGATLQRWFPPERQVATSVVDRVRQVMLANDRCSYLRCYRVFATADGELAEQVHRIAVPVAAVTGELDTGSTPAMTRRLAAAVPDGRYHILPEVGHMLPVEQPSVLADYISAFVKEHQP